MSLRIPSTSLEYVLVPVTVDGATPNPGLTVEMAIIADGTEEPASGDWKTAAWDSGRARLLVGTGGDIALTNGNYEIWVRITSSPEVPIRRAGRLVVT